MYASQTLRSDWPQRFDVTERDVTRDSGDVEHVVDIHSNDRRVYLCLSHEEAASLCRGLLAVLQATEHIDF